MVTSTYVPRALRIEGPNLIHHVTGNAAPTRDAFPDDLARRRFLALLAATVRSSDWLVLAYCLLTTHYHLLVRTIEPNLAAGVQRIHGRHAQLLNARLSTSGPLWRGRYHSRLVEAALHVVQAAAYIDANPVAAGICSSPADWPWSSYRANAGSAEPSHWHRPDVLHSFLGVDAVEAPKSYALVVTASLERARERSPYDSNRGGNARGV